MLPDVTTYTKAPQSTALHMTLKRTQNCIEFERVFGIKSKVCFLQMRIRHGLNAHVGIIRADASINNIFDKISFKAWAIIKGYLIVKLGFTK